MEKYTPSERCQKMARRIRIPSDLNEKNSVKVEVAIGTSDITIHAGKPNERIVKLASQKQLEYIYKELKLSMLVARNEVPAVASTQSQNQGSGSGKGNK